MHSDIVYWLNNGLYLNITNRCSNNCYFCFRRYWKGIAHFDLRLIQEPSVSQVIKDLSAHIHRRPWREVVFCGFGEPTARLDCVLQVTRWIRRYSNLKVRIDTNGHGHLLNPRREVVTELKEAGVDDVSVSLNGHNEETYNNVCKPSFPNAYEEVLKFIVNAKEPMNVEVTAVRIPEIEIAEIEKLALSFGVKFRLREYIPCFY
ncbi:MAG: TatD family nuclease-associated radical SAM protein [Candidatus Bathyarchaeia archaeon]